MKVTTKGKETRTSSGVVSTGFTIKSNAHAFKILSSNMYSNPRHAIIRELSTNALDAHAMNGNTEKPFDVTLPTQFNPVFVLRDYGPGLDIDNATNLYTTYFDSTKNDDNEAVGGLGLGSKSPLGYTDIFNVVSYHEGKAHYFAVIINEEGLPSINHLGSSDTDEPSGLEVSVPMKNNESSERAHWLAEAIDIYMWFPEGSVNIVNPSAYDDRLIDEDIASIVQAGKVALEEAADYDIVSYSTNVYFDGGNSRLNYHTSKVRIRSSGLYAQMGPIIYPVSMDRLVLPNNMTLNAPDSAVVMEFGIGELTIAPSREELHYDDETVSALSERVWKAVNNTITSITDAVEEIQTVDQVIEMAKNGLELDVPGGTYAARMASMDFRSLLSDRVQKIVDAQYNPILSVSTLSLDSERVAHKKNKYRINLSMSIPDLFVTHGTIPVEDVAEVKQALCRARMMKADKTFDVVYTEVVHRHILDKVYENYLESDQAEEVVEAVAELLGLDPSDEYFDETDLPLGRLYPRHLKGLVDDGFENFGTAYAFEYDFGKSWTRTWTSSNFFKDSVEILIEDKPGHVNAWRQYVKEERAYYCNMSILANEKDAKLIKAFLDAVGLEVSHYGNVSEFKPVAYIKEINKRDTSAMNIGVRRVRKDGSLIDSYLENWDIVSVHSDNTLYVSIDAGTLGSPYSLETMEACSKYADQVKELVNKAYTLPSGDPVSNILFYTASKRNVKAIANLEHCLSVPVKDFRDKITEMAVVEHKDYIDSIKGVSSGELAGNIPSFIMETIEFISDNCPDLRFKIDDDFTSKYVNKVLTITSATTSNTYKFLEAVIGKQDFHAIIEDESSEESKMLRDAKFCGKIANVFATPVLYSFVRGLRLAQNSAYSYTGIYDCSSCELTRYDGQNRIVRIPEVSIKEALRQARNIIRDQVITDTNTGEE